MAIAGMTTPLTSNTFKKLLLNAGAFIMNFDPSSYTTANALKEAVTTALADPTKRLGATRGGGTFTVTREMRQVEADGIRYRFVGDTFVDSSDAYLSTTLIETGSPNVIKSAINSADIIASGKKSVIKMRTRIIDSDYVQNLCWVGDVADGGFVVIWLKNAFNTSDLTITFTDKGEATLPVEFHAFQGNVDDYDYSPYELIFIDAPTYTAVQSPSGNPSTIPYYEKSGAFYVKSTDTTVQDGKTYYTAS